MNQNIPNYKKTAFLLTLLLALLSFGSLLWILSDPSANIPSTNLVANIYQDGKLIQSISLNGVEDPYTFTVIGEHNCRNEIEVRSGSIGIISADCPDKLCVNQGFIDSSLLPITCLPNHLVIQIQPKNGATESDTSVDIMTY